MNKIYCTLFFLFLALFVRAQDARNYGLSNGTFSTGITGVNAVLADMTTGTVTTLLGAGVSNTASAVAPIGFDVWYMGVRFTNFSVNANGVFRFGSTAIIPGGNSYTVNGTYRIVPISSGSFASETVPTTGNFQTAATVGKVHYKVIGTAPNRTLVVEWKDMKIGHRSTKTTYATFQAHVYETAPSPTTTSGGVIQFVYGAMPTDARNSSGTQVAINTRTGIGIGTAAGQYLSVITSGTSAVSATTTITSTSASEYENSLAVGANVPNLHTTTATARRFIRFEAPAVTGVPSNASASCITNTTATLTWTDPGTTNGVGIVVFRSLNGTNYSFLAQTSLGAQTYQDTGLTPGTPYYYRLYVVNEGKMSPLGAQASVNIVTPAGGTIAYAIGNGNWNAASTWSTNAAPGATTDVIIGCGYTVSLNPANAQCNNLTILSGASLNFSNNGGLTVNSNFSNAGTINFTANSVTANFKGNVTNSGSWVAGTSTITLSGTVQQNINNSGTSTVPISSATYASSSVSAPVPDAGGTSSGACTIATSAFTGANSANMSITVPTGTYTLNSVTTTIPHTWTADLEVWIAPAGSATAYKLVGSQGADSDGFSNVTFNNSAAASIVGVYPGATSPITGTYRPECTTFSSLTATGGTWRLYVNDQGAGDIGSLTAFSINLTSSVTKLSHLSFYNLIVNNTGAGIVSNDTITIIKDMDFTDGIVDIGAHEVRFLDDATSEAGNNGSHVNGQVRKVGNNAFSFPIGDGTYAGQCGISAPSNASDEFTANYTRQSPLTANYYPMATDGTIANVSEAEYWNIDRVVGTSNVSVSLSYENVRSQGVANPDSLIVAHWTGAQWKNEGRSASFVTPYTGITSSAAITNFSPFTLGNIGTSAGNINILPVTLVDFTANKLDNETVKLAWQTSSEVNSSHFLVERSFDGVSFLPIGSVDAQGESKSIQNYALLDTDGELSSHQIAYYRLKMIDNDASFEYSRIRQVNFDLGTFQILTVYPNPFNQQTTVSFSLPEDSEVEWVVYDLLGRAVQSHSLSAQSGVNELELANWNSLPSGTYILMGSSQGKRLTQKVIKTGN